MQDKRDIPFKEESVKTIVDHLLYNAKTDTEKLEKIYYFVRDTIKFGWVYPMEISAEEVLRNKRGVCMQKSNLLVAMAREAGLKARFHFLLVHKNALEDFLPVFAYKRWADTFPHTVPEVYLDKRWISVEATFDKELHEICLKKKINFGKHDKIVGIIAIEFSKDGVKGHQQYCHAEGKESSYGEDLSELTNFMKNNVVWWKKILQPFIFNKAQKIMDELRRKNK